MGSVRHSSEHSLTRRKSPKPQSRHGLGLADGYQYIRTAMTDALLQAEPEVEKTWMAGALLGRLGAPEDFKAPIVFLLGSGSSFMTGANLTVDGGHCASA